MQTEQLVENNTESRLHRILNNNSGFRDKESVFLSILNTKRDTSKTTEKYKETDDLLAIEMMNEAGWYVTDYKQRGVRNKEAGIYKEYIATYKNQSLAELEGEGVLTVIQYGSHDGTRKYGHRVGFNTYNNPFGLIVGSNLFQPIDIKHIGGLPEHVGTVINSITSVVPLVYNRIKEMQKIELDLADQLELAQEAVNLRYPEKEDRPALNLKDLLVKNIYKDTDSNSIWRTLLRVQNNVLKSHGFTITGKTGRVSRSRKVKNISLVFNINTGLWNKAEELLARQ